MNVDPLALRKAARLLNIDFEALPDTRELDFQQAITLLTVEMDEAEAEDWRKQLAADTRAGKTAARKSGILRICDAWIISTDKHVFHNRPLTADEITDLDNGGKLKGDHAVYDDVTGCITDSSGPYIHWHYSRESIAAWLGNLGKSPNELLCAWLGTSWGNPISFYQAVNILADKLNKPKENIEHELAGWLSRGDLKAYSSIRMDEYSEFDSDDYRDKSKANNYEYLPYLQGLYFRQSDIENFRPQTRYITGAKLIDQWVKHLGSKEGVITKVETLSNDRRLDGFHPFYFSFYPKVPELRHDVPLKMHLFDLAQVESIECEDFSTSEDAREVGASPEPTHLSDGGKEPKAALPVAEMTVKTTETAEIGSKLYKQAGAIRALSKLVDDPSKLKSLFSNANKKPEFQACHENGGWDLVCLISFLNRKGCLKTEFQEQAAQNAFLKSLNNS
ncbi:MAG: hypothetical protein NTX45_16945 [Proteobacteria bacterium]|nr:hypothetical protein [Pseudomonadota bacterium]